jgi:hypothetical protein
MSDITKLPSEDEILDGNEAATFLHVSLPVLRRLGDSSALRYIQLPGSKRGHRRYRMSDLIAFISDCLSTSEASKSNSTTTQPK